MTAIDALGESCFLLKNALTPQDQVQLFRFVHERDATDWDNLPSCMNPTPKTLELVVHLPEHQRRAMDQEADATARTISIHPQEDQLSNVVTQLVEKAKASILIATNCSNAALLQLQHSIQSISLSVIRYCIQGSSSTVGSILPPHIDHCNDGSWVILFSLGCTVDFFVQCPTTTQNRTDEERRHNFEMKSGDVIVFDPSSKARILHGVTGVVANSSSSSDGKVWEEVGGGLSMLRESRLGVQCRVLFG